jgi:SAM-dependent methyltransferase
MSVSVRLDRTPSVWDGIFSARPWGRWPAEEVVRAVARLSGGGAQPLRVLEVGCGPGAQLWFLGHEGHTAVGIDLSEVGIAKASERLRAEDQVARLAVANALALPVAAASFDLVIDVEAFSCLHEDDTLTAWREAARVVRPGGHLVSIAFTPATYGAAQGRRLGTRTVTDVPDGPIGDLGVVSFLDEPTARDVARAAGLELVDVQLRSRTAGVDHDVVEELVLTLRKPV